VSPFACGLLGEAPEQELPAPPPAHCTSDHGKGESERGRGVAVGGGLDLVQPRLLQPSQRKFSFLWLLVMPAKAGIIQ
jgi:hypothetical protein